MDKTRLWGVYINFNNYYEVLMTRARKWYIWYKYKEVSSKFSKIYIYLDLFELFFTNIYRLY